MNTVKSFTTIYLQLNQVDVLEVVTLLTLFRMDLFGAAHLRQKDRFFKS